MSNWSDKEVVQLSKFLSLILRHKPETIGLSLTDQGWADIEELILKAASHGRNISRELLDEVVFTSDKQRFAFSPDGLSIRANQGHSIEIDLELKPQTPPEILYHGTVNKFLPQILTQGLQKMRRHHVHLSADRETAYRVGGRRGWPVILLVDAKAMEKEGFLFYQSHNGVWLTDHVPHRFIQKEIQP